MTKTVETETLYSILENAHEYILQALPHLGDVQGNEHQVAHIEHFIRQAEAWVSKAIAGLDPGEVPTPTAKE